MNRPPPPPAPARAVIGITGHKGSGKDTAAEAVAAQGFTHVKLADALKAMLRKLLACQGADAEMIRRMIDGDLKEAPTPLLEGRTPRQAMQTLGTEWGRDRIGRDLCDGPGPLPAAAMDGQRLTRKVGNERPETAAGFDPALRDRARAERLFGFHFRIEIFVPEARRTYGYYVFPVLQGDRVIGRLDARRTGTALVVRAFWPEAGVRMGKGRTSALTSELERVRALAGVETVEFCNGWLRE